MAKILVAVKQQQLSSIFFLISKGNILALLLDMDFYKINEGYGNEEFISIDINLLTLKTKN